MTHSPNREGAVCLVDALASSLSLDRDAIVVGRTKVFLRARAEACIEGARDKALRKSALKELETAIEMENVDALEAAVAIATELRLDGSVLDRARSRVAVLRFRKHTASFKEVMKAMLPDMHRDVLQDIHRNASVFLDEAARVAQAETTAAWAMAADIDTFKQILRRLRRKLRKLEERCKSAAALERAGNEVMETCRDLELIGEDAMRVLENARADLEAAHKAAEESGVPPTAPEALIALKAADVLAVAFDRHLQQAEEEKAERDAFLDHMRGGQEEGKDADSPATLARRSVDVDLDAVPPSSPVREMKPPPVPPPEVTVTPPDSLPDDDVQVIVPKPPAYADEARPATWLSDAEQHTCQALSKKVSSAIVVADDPERRARALALERPAVKLQKNGSEWKRVVLTRRPAVLRCLHAIDATRFHQTRSWVVSFSILRPFGPRRETAMLRTGRRAGLFSVAQSEEVVLFSQIDGYGEAQRCGTRVSRAGGTPERWRGRSRRRIPFTSEAFSQSRVAVALRHGNYGSEGLRLRVDKIGR